MPDAHRLGELQPYIEQGILSSLGTRQYGIEQTRKMFGVSASFVSKIADKHYLPRMIPKTQITYPYGPLYAAGSGRMNKYYKRTLHPSYWLWRHGNREGHVGRRSMLEHRRVMAEYLDRPLNPDEHVHHLNGDPRDNRIENLELTNGSHGNQQRWVCASCGCSDRKAVPLNA